MILYKFQEFWHENGFNILMFLSVLFLFVYWLSRIGKKGTYSTENSDKFVYSESNVKSPSVWPASSSPKESKLEQACRRSLQEIFRRPFHKARPDFLRNPVTQNFNLELDCFDPDLKLAVEANGIQHYKYVPYFHKNKDAFQNQQYRDELKRRMCKDNGITLIEVPYTIKEPQIKSYILERVRRHGYKV